ncbi:MAG: hypothetical protein FD156_1459 [Nitrospirae bacterium]|nr:MAG: hypothetical protein FD156_1459 [Nitrospirota bacterium]
MGISSISAVESFDIKLTKQEHRAIARLDTPDRIQAFLDKLAYSSEDSYRSPLHVLRERTCQCFDGALFAAAMLRRLGQPALILNLLPNNRDDDHILALFRMDSHWGAIAKSNFAGLRFREPVYRSLRELVMSYFELYFNVEAEKTLRGYTLPVNLKAFDKHHWLTKPEALELISHRLDRTRRVSLLTRRMIAGLSLADERSCRAGLFGANKAGLYKPPRKKH